MRGWVGILICILTLLLAGSSLSVAGWSNGGYSADPDNPDLGTHDWIADKALSIQTRDASFLKTTYHTEYLLGTEAPDNPDYIGDSTNHHIYYYSDGSVQDDVCADRAKAMYDLALPRIEGGEYSIAAYYIGAMAHYVSDVGVFGHTMGAYTDWGAEVHHSDFESEFEDFIDTLTLPSGTALGDSSAYDATSALARTITFGSGSIKSNIWMDTNYDWANDVFDTSAKASLYSATSAVASVINHLLAATEPPDVPDDPEPPDVPDEPPIEVPDPPTSLEAYVDGSRVVLTWAAPANNGGGNIVEYKIYRGYTTSYHHYMATVPNTAQTWADESVEKGKTCYYWVVAKNSAGDSIMSEMASAIVPEQPTSWLLPALLSAISVGVASAGALLWRRGKKRGKKR
jgi:hypothetical protein